MKDLNSHCRLAIVQAAPVMFDKDACLAKALRLIEEAAQNGAELIVFPELFLPGYPARNRVAPTGRSITTIRSCPMAQKCSS